MVNPNVQSFTYYYLSTLVFNVLMFYIYFQVPVFQMVRMRLYTKCILHLPRNQLKKIK